MLNEKGIMKLAKKLAKKKLKGGLLDHVRRCPLCDGKPESLEKFFVKSRVWPVSPAKWVLEKHVTKFHSHLVTDRTCPITECASKTKFKSPSKVASHISSMHSQVVFALLPAELQAWLRSAAEKWSLPDPSVDGEGVGERPKATPTSGDGFKEDDEKALEDTGEEGSGSGEGGLPIGEQGDRGESEGMRTNLGEAGGSLDEGSLLNGEQERGGHRQAIEREGGRRGGFTTTFKRNPRAKQGCLDHWGYKCYVCEVDFGHKFGGRGRACIHVHHVVPISRRPEGEHWVDPISDLRPVCRNCHAMLHADDALTMDDLKRIVLST